ncbi:Chitin synthase, class 3 [Podila humilis]|nr:Chitin synthase, class 3 [Podila humilis]
MKLTIRTFVSLDNHIDSVIVRGGVYHFETMQEYLRTKKADLTMSPDFRGRDISALFYDSSAPCSGYPMVNITSNKCVVPNPYNNSPIVATPCLDIREFTNKGPKASGKLSFLWTDLTDTSRHDFDNLIIYDGKIFNVSSFVNGNQAFGSEVNSVLHRSLRKDASLLFSRTESRKKALACLQSVADVGILENTTMGCFAAKTIMLTTMICVCLVVAIKFLMAVSFSWFLSYRLTEKPRAVLKSAKKEAEDQSKSNNNGQDLVRVRGKNAANRKNPYTVMLVTCYSEGENSIRTTLDSLANTSYSTKHKLMMIICDGIVRGHGNKMTTPDIVVNMLDLIPGSELPKAASYLAVADGEKQHNMAKVYAGHYVYKKKRVPTVVIVKCGNPLEKDATKPGNRGKRDSQLIMMSFFQRVLFADRFTELDFEVFHKIHSLMNIWPDKFELVLMVDADTMVKGDSLSYMVTAMQNDVTIMGLCGETKIANKTSSWVTAIQVFEYYISHHLGKAFESVFGGVTCLPGCFCMYRLKAPKHDSWVPILANPEVIEEYNQNIVSTLHQKNLLLLGEDRYLTTLMLRTFPKRQMVFVPQAQCKTVVPDTFKVLLSQRRRWINSTIHNLLELVLVTDLCGIAFLSMQFVVLLELIGTVVLPASIMFTIGIIAYAIIKGTMAVVPLILILVMIGLPAVLIVLTTRKWIYVLWMLIYLLSLPLWNFILPLYSFWHFDDFSWGETRKVANQKRKSGQDHGDAEGVFESGSIVMRKWEEWEKERLKAMGYRIQKRHSADHGINDLPPPAASTMDLNKAPQLKNNSKINLAASRSMGHANVRPGGNVGPSAVATGSTPSLGTTLTNSAGSLRMNTPPGQRPYSAMPGSTPQQQQQQLQQRQSLALGNRPPMVGRPRPPPPSQMLNSRPNHPGQAFELAPMNTSHAPPRTSFMPPGNMLGGRPPGEHVGMEIRNSILEGPSPNFMAAPRPMHPLGSQLPQAPGSGTVRPMNTRPFSPQGSGPGYMPESRSPFSGPVGTHPAPPPLLFPNYQHQPYPSTTSPPPQQFTTSGPNSSGSYPLPPGSNGSQQQLVMPGDRQSRVSDTSVHSGPSSSGRSAAHGSVATVPAPLESSSAPYPPPPVRSPSTGATEDGDGVVVLSDEFRIPVL